MKQIIVCSLFFSMIMLASCETGINTEFIRRRPQKSLQSPSTIPRTGAPVRVQERSSIPSNGMLGAVNSAMRMFSTYQTISIVMSMYASARYAVLRIVDSPTPIYATASVLLSLQVLRRISAQGGIIASCAGILRTYRKTGILGLIKSGCKKIISPW